MIAFLILISIGHSNPQYLKRSIEDSLHFNVVVDDILGDEDGYDNDPMQVTTHVNCMVWLQWVLARYYTYLEHGYNINSIETNHAKYLNEIRYFQEPYTFGNRIHYVDRWIFVGENYLVPNSSCQRSKTKSISLPLKDFFMTKGWDGDIYVPQANTIIFPYSTNAEFLDCVYYHLPDGFYLVFPVANEEYKHRWNISGDIGLVHSMILEVDSVNKKLWHASIDMEKVLAERPEDFVNRISHLIDGYVVVDILR